MLYPAELRARLRLHSRAALQRQFLASGGT
jgi:hypothetical protein